MSATESASQKGTKAGTETRPGDLERERESRGRERMELLFFPPCSSTLQTETSIVFNYKFSKYLDLADRHCSDEAGYSFKNCVNDLVSFISIFMRRISSYLPLPSRPKTRPFCIHSFRSDFITMLMKNTVKGLHIDFTQFDCTL